MENARELLEEAGSSLDHVTMVTTYLTDPGYRVPVYRRWPITCAATTRSARG